MPKCDQCGKEFAGEHALKIHIGRQHGSKARKPGAANNGTFDSHVCPDCGRAFKLALHLARHRAAAHRTAGETRRKGRVARRKTAVTRLAKVSGLDVLSLSIDDLLALKGQVNARLKDIATMMKKSGL